MAAQGTLTLVSDKEEQRRLARQSALFMKVGSAWVAASPFDVEHPEPGVTFFKRVRPGDAR